MASTTKVIDPNNIEVTTKVSIVTNYTKEKLLVMKEKAEQRLAEIDGWIGELE